MRIGHSRVREIKEKERHKTHSTMEIGKGADKTRNKQRKSSKRTKQTQAVGENETEVSTYPGQMASLYSILAAAA
jgi:hypothetical protein